MKKIKFLVPVLAASAFIISCGGGSGNTSAPTVTPTGRSQSTATAISPIATATQAPATPTTAADPVATGRSLAARNGCSACHSNDGSAGIGPTWKGLFGSETELSDGSTALADEAYLKESIVSPNAKIAKGFSGNIMPQDFGQKLSAEQIDAIVAYIRSLK